MNRRTLVVLIAVLLFLLAFPLLIVDPTVTTIAVFTLLFASAATAWNLFSGYTGYISLGHATFYGIGGYALALICQRWHIEGGYTPFILLPLVGLIAFVFALPLGWIALRARRHLFVVITIAIFYIFQLMAYNLSWLTNGSAGLFLPTPPWDAASFNTPFYYVSLIVLLLSISVSWWMRHSKYGLGLLAIRDDEDRALSLGVRTGASKVIAYAISAYFVGVIGAISAYFIGSLYPQFAFTPALDVTVALMALLGGVGTLLGPIFGAVLLEPIQQYLTVQLGTNGLDLVLFGVLLLAVILFLPQGIIPTLRDWWIKYQATREQRGEAREGAVVTELAQGGGDDPGNVVKKEGINL
jgi:branched-chain amino acid transport system permease protein